MLLKSCLCVWCWGMVQIQNSGHYQVFFSAVPHLEGVMFNINCILLMLHRTWFEASSKPSKILVKCWGFMLFVGLNSLFTVPTRVWAAQRGTVPPPAPTQLCRAKEKTHFGSSCTPAHLALFSKTHGHLTPAHPHWASFPGRVYSVSHILPQRV